MHIDQKSFPKKIHLKKIKSKDEILVGLPPFPPPNFSPQIKKIKMKKKS